MLHTWSWHVLARAPSIGAQYKYAQAHPTIAEAFAACVADGATVVIISPYFLSPGRHWQEDLPALAAAAAAAHPGVRYLVAAPLAQHPLVCEVLEARVRHCLAHDAGQAPACDVCRSAGMECSLRFG
jgi:sirohydrochlorin ferrochelatase